MTWLELKTLLNEYFKDDELIYPHAGVDRAGFYRARNGDGVAWLKLKTRLNEHFRDDELIYPHAGPAGLNHVSFYKVNRGQEFFTIEVEPGKTSLFEVKNGKKI